MEWINDDRLKFPDPRIGDKTDVTRLLASIVAVEGPVICHRVYKLYIKAAGLQRAGKEINKILNRAMAEAVRQNLVFKAGLDPGGPQAGMIVRPGLVPDVVQRVRGPREFDEIPRDELACAMRQIQRQEPDLPKDSLFRSVLAIYGFSRLTAAVKEALTEIFEQL